MNPKILSADDAHRAAPGGFRARHFGRVVAFTKPYRRSLVLGLLITVAFAGLHTVGITAAFPVFKILLEDEGLHGWVDRTVVGDRLGIDLAPLQEDDSVRILRVEVDSPFHDAGIAPGDDLVDVDGRPIKLLLSELAGADTGTPRDVMAGRPGETKRVTVELRPIGTVLKALQWAVSFLPPDAKETRLQTLGYILIVLVGIVVVSNVLRYIGEILIAGAVLHAMLDLRDRLYVHTLHLPMSYFSGTQTSDLVTRFVQDIQEIQRGLVTLFGKAIREPLRAMFLLGVALLLDWRITIMIIVIAPLATVMFLAVGRKAKKANRRLLQAYGNMIGALTTSLQNLRVVKAYTAEECERAHLDVVDRRVLKEQLKLARLDAFLSPMMETLGVIAASAFTVWLAGRVIDQTLSVPMFGTLSLTLAMLFDPLRKLSDVYVRIQRSTAGAERIFSVLDQPVETSGVVDAVTLAPLKESIELRGVSFTYPGGGAPALNDVSISIAKGETVAIVGPNGCGKTTLVSLLPRLFDPDSGEIRYDGVEIRDASLSSLRRQIGVVSQDAIVFAGTPLENIAYGQANVDRARAEDAARRAYADEFIRNLPGGYEAVLGERGTTLSGGERQRIAIARAIYRDAPILIFDEATSQIDSESELKIQTALREFAKGRTTIIVAHRLSTIQFATRIIVMDAGRVIDSGSHKQLVERCKLYQNLCETQLVAQGT
ncbi:MAG: ATP-binding cassette domain-containing protein [Planctomycetes bacterium]|nr:ATP-binding cassette domain-containing protein [Planctomycetota bacterium]